MPGRSTKPLSAKLERNLAKYAVAAEGALLPSRLERSLASHLFAAGAAGLALLSLAQPARGEVIYTPAHVKLGDGGLRSYRLDINHDGLTEITFWIGTFNDEIRLYAAGANYGYRIQMSSESHFANARKTGGKIGRRKQFDIGNRSELMALESSHGGVFGPWVNVKQRYLGLQLLFDNWHYGWARLNVHFTENHTIQATLTGYAYETIKRKPIVAGDEGTGAKSLGHLALGAVGKRRAPMTVGK